MGIHLVAVLVAHAIMGDREVIWGAVERVLGDDLGTRRDQPL